MYILALTAMMDGSAKEQTIRTQQKPNNITIKTDKKL